MSSPDSQLTAEWRTDFGKGAARRLRRDGLVPAVMYGSGSEVRHVVLPAHETNLALRGAQVVLQVSIGGKTVLVAPREVQRHPVRADLLHVDMVLLSDAEVAERHAYADAVEKAQALAEEAGFDPMQASHVIEEAYAADEDVQAAAENIVKTLEEQAAAMTAAAAAAAAAEAAAAEGEAEAGGAAEAAESGDSQEA